MSANDKILIKIQADITDMNQKMSALLGTMQGFQREVKNTDAVSQQLNTGLKAFSWTTFTQGALNASTAMAQLYTSASNLNRVQYLVKQATVSVERAEDQLARKTLQLNKEVEKNGLLSEKSKILMNEISTASEQLANKQERLRLAQDQVNDTYILYTSNIANTLFGVAQTLIGLKTMIAQKALAEIAATKALTLANADETKSVAALTAAKTALLGSTTALTTAQTREALTTVTLGRAYDTTALSAGKLTTAQTGLLGRLGQMSGTTMGVTAGLGYLAFNIAKAGYSMDEMDGQVDGLYTRFKDVTVQSAEFGKQLDLVMDKGDAWLQFGNKLAEGLSMGFYQAPDISGFTKESKEKMKKDLGSFYNDKIKTVEDYEKAVMLKQQAAADRAATLRSLDVYAGLKKGKTSIELGLTPDELSKLSKDRNEIMQYRSDLIEQDKLEGKLQSDKTKYLEKALEYYAKEHEWGKDIIDVYREQILQQDKLNNSMKEGNKIRGNTLKLEQEIENLKKKLSPRYLFEQATKSVLQGSFTEGFIERTLGKEWVDKVGYMPFSGSYTVDPITKKVKEVTANLELFTLSRQMAIIIGEMEQEILAGNMDRVEVLRNRLEKTTSGRNISSNHPSTSLAFSALSRVSSNVNDIFRRIKATGATSGYKGIHGNISLPASMTMGQTTAGLLSSLLQRPSSRSNAANRAASLSRSLSTSMDGAKRGGLTSARGSKGKRSGRHGGRRNRLWNEENERWIIAAQEAKDFYETIDTALEDFAISIGFPGAPQHIFIRNAAEEKRYNASVLAYQNTIKSIQESVSAYVAPIGITDVGSIYNIVTNPQTANDIDDMLRYNARLAQISTGATVI